MDGEPIQIVSFDEHDRCFKLNLDALRFILLKQRFRLMKVAVIAFSGPSRIGKSFVLSYIIRFLRQQSMGDLGQPLTNGFPWTQSSKRQTLGIYAWSELFVQTNTDGEEIAIMLLDTQGYFDGKTEHNNQAVLFALSTMVSSIQVYNVPNDIQDDKLYFLKYFIEYGKEQIRRKPPLRPFELGPSRPFQKLLFLIRDWKFPFDRGFGLEGGSLYVSEAFDPTGQLKSQDSMRSAIPKCFNDVEGYLLPHPGSGVTKKTFDGSRAQLDAEFVEHLTNFIELLLHPDHLEVKDINGQRANCLTLYKHFQMCSAVLGNSGDSLEEGIGQSFFVASYSKALQQYMLAVTDFVACHRFMLSEQNLLSKHADLKKESLETYTKSVSESPYTDDRNYQHLYLGRLEQSIESVFGKVLMQQFSDGNIGLNQNCNRRKDEGSMDLNKIPDFSSYSNWTDSKFKQVAKHKNKSAMVKAVSPKSSTRKRQPCGTRTPVTENFDDFRYYHRRESLLGEMIDAADLIFVSTIIRPTMKALSSAFRIFFGGLKSACSSLV